MKEYCDIMELPKLATLDNCNLLPDKNDIKGLIKLYVFSQLGQYLVSAFTPNCNIKPTNYLVSI